MNIDKTVSKILRVNHAGELGAIRIYKAQLFVSRFLYKDLVTFLEETLAHEIKHCQQFREAMYSRNTRPCYTTWVWSIGGFILGFITALMGRNMIMACTESVEETVHRHLNEQIEFTKSSDVELCELIEEIKIEELEHLGFAQNKVRHNVGTKLVSRFIGFSTNILIWLSTQGDVSRMQAALTSEHES